MTPLSHEETQTVVNAKTAVYLRYWKGTDAETSDHQKVELLRYCSARGWENLEVYTDTATGGKSSRPALEQLMRKVRIGEIARVVCHTLDALGRSLTHLCLLVEETSRLGVPLHCVHQSIDTSDGHCARALAAVCQFRRSLYRERVNSGLSAARNRGVRLGRPSTLNKRRDEVLELKAKGMGVRGIAREIGMPVASVFKLMKEAA